MIVRTVVAGRVGTATPGADDHVIDLLTLA
jgi:hypothetical protein